MSSAADGRGAGSSAARTRDRLVDVLAPVVAEAGCELEDITVTNAGRRSLVRVVVDADGGVDLDAVAVVSRAVSDALDGDGRGADAFSGPYVLEVSSPGVDRPLVEPRHWRRAVGRLVSVPVGERTVTGRVQSTNDAGVSLDVDGTNHEIAWTDLGRGRVQVEFNHVSGSDDDSAGDG